MLIEKYVTSELGPISFTSNIVLNSRHHQRNADSNKLCTSAVILFYIRTKLTRPYHPLQGCQILAVEH